MTKKIAGLFVLISILSAFTYALTREHCQSYIIWLGYKNFDCSFPARLINFYAQNKVNTAGITILSLIILAIVYFVFDKRKNNKFNST